MDARLDLFGRLGVAVGDAHLLRNAGGRVTDDVVRSLALSTQLFGSREIGVIHHLDCGLQGRANDDLVRATGVDIDFLPFDDIDASVIGDVERIRALPWLPADALVWGGVLSVHDGSLRTVAPPDGPLPTRTG